MIILGILIGTAVAFVLISIITGLDIEELIEKLVFIGIGMLTILGLLAGLTAIVLWVGFIGGIVEHFMYP